jgi:hypothetical protein
VIEHDRDAAHREKGEGHTPERPAHEERPEAIRDEITAGGDEGENHPELIRSAAAESVREEAAERVGGETDDAIGGEHEAEAGRGDTRCRRMRGQEHVEHLVAEQGQGVREGETDR